MHCIMMPKLAVNISVSVNHHGFSISWSDMNMKVRIGV